MRSVYITVQVGDIYVSQCVCYLRLRFRCPALTTEISEDAAADKERTCDSLLMCIVTVLSHGLRSGGGVGDVLRRPSKEVPPGWGGGGGVGRVGVLSELQH